MSVVHMMGEYTCAYIRREEELICGDCNKKYESNYEFMVLSCGCRCEDSFRICEVCSPMFVQCECGCEGNYKNCCQRKTEGNLMVSVFIFQF